MQMEVLMTRTIIVIDFGMSIAKIDPVTTIIIRTEVRRSSFCNSGFFHRSFMIMFSKTHIRMNEHVKKAAIKNGL